MTDKKIETNIEVLPEGGVNWKISSDDEQFLIALQESHGWKVFRKLLKQYKVVRLESCIAVTDPNILLKETGISAGVNLVINQLDIIVATVKDKNNKKDEQVKGAVKT